MNIGMQSRIFLFSEQFIPVLFIKTEVLLGKNAAMFSLALKVYPLKELPDIEEVLAFLKK